MDECNSIHMIPFRGGGKGRKLCPNGQREPEGTRRSGSWRGEKKELREALKKTKGSKKNKGKKHQKKKKEVNKRIYKCTQIKHTSLMQAGGPPKAWPRVPCENRKKRKKPHKGGGGTKGRRRSGRKKYFAI